MKIKKIKIDVATLGHYIYFNQFNGLREELMQKSEQFRSFLDPSVYDIVDVGYIDRVEDAFDAVRKLKKEDANLLFILVSTYVPSTVFAPFA